MLKRLFNSITWNSCRRANNKYARIMSTKILVSGASNGYYYQSNNTSEINNKKRKLTNGGGGSISNNEGNVHDNNSTKNGHTRYEIPPCKPVDMITTVERRNSSISKAVEIHYPESPLYIHHGKGQYMYDENNREYLDLMNNVAHVGHCHPVVTQAGTEQMKILSTNSRFLHSHILDVAERLKNTFPHQLKVCFFVNSGTEANDLALRMAEIYTKHRDVVVLNNAYHGHSLAVHEISPYKTKRFADHVTKDYVHVLPSPDTYRGKYQGDNDDPHIGDLYAKDAIDQLNEIVKRGRKIGMFIAESMQSCGGQIIFPNGYLKKIYDHIHALGGVCVADEVQVGFGRSGKAGYWAFEQYGVTPDMVSVGKPMGNGHPVACLITTEKIAQALKDTEVGYFNTYGGNPVSMAISHAVMKVIEDEKLRENAEDVGKYALTKLRELYPKHQNIGDIRGVGLFFGVEIVKDRMTKEPATDMTRVISFRLREYGILMSRDGPHQNVLKGKPPMVITKKDIDHFVEILDKVFNEIEEKTSE